MRLIDADELKRRYMLESDISEPLSTYTWGDIDAMFNRCVDMTKTIEAEPVRHGEWLDTHMKGVYRCSECNAYWADGDVPIYFRYCPNCGARMDEEKKNETD